MNVKYDVYTCSDDGTLLKLRVTGPSTQCGMAWTVVITETCTGEHVVTLTMSKIQVKALLTAMAEVL